MSDTQSNRTSIIAAAVFMIVAGCGLYFMPKIMLFIGEESPWLAFAFGALFVLGFFAVFWLRGRYQRSRGR